jgi:hypothetical protein
MLWHVLVQLLLLVLLSRVVHKRLHPLCEHHQILVKHPMWNSLLVHLEHLESIVVTRCNQIAVF